MDKKYALISVNDKTNLINLAQGLSKVGYSIITTGGTAKELTSNGLDVIPVEDITCFPECLDGRLKTLHPNIFGGLLALRDNDGHCNTVKEQGIPLIDVLVVNLYPFKETIAQTSHNLADAIENIDIGGPAMIRAAAKNYKYTAVVTDIADYEELIDRIQKNNLDDAYRYQLAAKAFSYTANYDTAIANYLQKGLPERKLFPNILTLTFNKHSDMRYGENPHQQAAYYVRECECQSSIENAEILHGKPLSFNNVADAHAAVSLVREFTNQAVCAAVKHATPCGVALGINSLEAFNGAYECDPLSIFGGIVAFNCHVDKLTAQKLHEIFLEVIIAPSFCPDALEILTKKKNLRLLTLPMNSTESCEGAEDSKNEKVYFEFKSVGGGMLIQESDNNDIGNEDHSVVTNTVPTEDAIKDLVFAMKVVKHVKSNAIVIAKNGRAIGIGGGEVSRIQATHDALDQALKGAKSLNGAVMASDAMIPFPDVINACEEKGIIAVIQPGGSKNDQTIIDKCNEHGLAMIFTGIRHFRH